MNMQAYFTYGDFTCVSVKVLCNVKLTLASSKVPLLKKQKKSELL